MSYTHPILVPGAKGHDDPEALREVIERLSAFEPRQLLQSLYTVSEDLAVAGVAKGRHKRDHHLDQADEVLDRCIDVVRRLL